MKFSSRTGAIALASILTSVTAISSIAHAENVQVLSGDKMRLSIALDCNAHFVKEFTQVPVIKNSTSTVISSGKTIYWQEYWAGKKGAKHSLILSKALSPGQTVNTGVKLSGDNNSCKAYY